MKILVIGATGFIGKGIYNFLKRGENEIVAGVRDVKSFDKVSIKIDFTTLQDDKELVSKLTGFDVVVNAVGIIAETKTQSFEQMHTTAPIELFYACKEAKVKKVIQLSALGSTEGSTDGSFKSVHLNRFRVNSGAILVSTSLNQKRTSVSQGRTTAWSIRLVASTSSF